MKTILFLVSAFLAGNASSQEAVPCTQEGQESQLAAGYFLCKNGFYLPVACATDDGVRVDLGSNYTKPNYYFVFECRNTSLYTVHLTQVACQQQGNAIKPGDTYVLQSFFYTCTQKAPNSLVFQASGCVSPTGEKIQANTLFKTKDFVYNCFTKPDGSIYQQPQACIVDGKEYQPETDVDSDAKSCWYRCQRTGDNGLRLQVMGCLEGGKKYAVGEHIIFGDFVYQCIRASDESVTREPIGCVETGKDGAKVEHKFGERWTEGGSNLKYVQECKGDSKSVFKSPVQCVYEGPDGQGQLDAGCMRRFGASTVLQCYKGENAVYGQLITDAPADFEDRLKAAGLKVC